jgi:DNA-binding transcriptional ArsR family regulator
MPIRISFPTADQPGLELTSFALTELYLSLLVVRNPARGPAMLAPFGRRVRGKLPKPVLAELRALSFLLGPPFPPELLFPEDELAGEAPKALAVLAPSDESLRWSVEMMTEELVSKDPAHHAAIEEARRDPAAIIERMVELLRSYWTHAFADEWPRVRAELAIAQAEARMQLTTGGIAALLAHSTRRARLATGGISIRPTVPIDIDIPLHEGEGLPVVLSLFSAPFVYTRIGPSAAVVLPAPAAARHVASPSLELVRGLSAIADPTRLTLLRLIATCPRSTRELSQLLELSESAVSKHVKTLAEADLVKGVRRGYYVLYELVPERAADASDALRDFLTIPGIAGSDSRSS